MRDRIKRALQQTSARPSASTTPVDSALFRDLIGPVRELKETTAPKPRPPPPPPVPKQSLLDEAHVMHELLDPPDDPELLDGGEVQSFLADGLSPKILRKLKRGGFAVQDEIDLHALTRAQAQKLFAIFLRDVEKRNVSCIRVIHGKGLRSPDQRGVLKSLVDFWLRKRQNVLAFTSAPISQGGTGAVLVLLRRK
jgi:DNA-nicking Smr family endonuclease